MKASRTLLFVPCISCGKGLTKKEIASARAAGNPPQRCGSCKRGRK